MRSVLGVHWKDCCWSWNSNILATWCKELTHLKRPWWWERLKVGGEGDDRGWDGWMVSLTQWLWVWVNSRNWWWTGRPVMLQSMGSQRVGHEWVTELNWAELKEPKIIINLLLHLEMFLCYHGFSCCIYFCCLLLDCIKDWIACIWNKLRTRAL